jgi:hypothetical protein
VIPVFQLLKALAKFGGADHRHHFRFASALWLTAHDDNKTNDP